MKKTLNKIMIVGALAFAVTSCTVITPVTASNAEIGELKGTSETIVFAGIEFNGNFGIKEAAKKGRITSAIATVDLETTNYMIFQKKKLIVTAK